MLLARQLDRRDFALLIPVLGCMSLVASAVVVAQKRRLWNDEILSLVLLQDPSFSHMMHAWGDTFNQAPPLYFIFGWGWDKFFGSSDLSLRLLGSFSLCIGLLLTWHCLARVWGSLAAGIGVVSIYCFSSLIIYHNTEARMYGLLVATCAIGLYLYQKISTNEHPNTAVLAANIVTQGAIVLTHLYGILYSGAFLLSLIITDRTLRRVRKRIYVSFVGGWAFLIPFLPGLINQSHNEAKWFEKVSFQKFLWYYQVSDVFGFYLLLIFLSSALMYILRYPSLDSPIERSISINSREARSIIIVGIVFLAVPVLPWLITVTIKPMMVDRYIIPTLAIGWPLVLTSGLWKLLFAQGVSSVERSLMVALLAGPALAYPLLWAYNFPAESYPGQNDAAFGYVDLPIAMEAGHDYLPRMHYSAQPDRYFHIRDWETAVKNTASVIATGDYTHLAALNRHYPYVQSVESSEFLAKHDRFLVWNERDQKWFEWRILSNPNYAVKLLGTDRGSRGPLELYLVEKMQR